MAANEHGLQLGGHIPYVAKTNIMPNRIPIV